MKNSKLAVVIFAAVLIAALMSFSGCKEKKAEPADSVTSTVKDVTKTVTESIEQTTCPIMGNKINKDVFTEYQGKKVYFCCKGCDTKFNAEPEKYLSKLPQFSK